MMCPQCGLPVSPSRTSCPRCGIPVKEMGERGGPGQSALLFPQALSSSLKQEEEKSKQQAGGTQLREGNQIQQYSRIDKYQQYAKQGKARSSIFSSIFLNSPSRTRLGFTAAGVCIGVGALILIIVFILAQSLPAPANADVQPAPQNEGNKAAATVAIIPTPSPEPSPTAPSVTPTPGTPGSKYIDNIQIGTTMNMNRVEITQVTKDFQAGQRIYITMNVNSAGYQGAVCLDWYVQNSFLTHYAFPTTADPSLPHSTAWSYATSTRQGPGYVNVFWASSMACADKVLAQKVDFNISG